MVIGRDPRPPPYHRYYRTLHTVDLPLLERAIILKNKYYNHHEHHERYERYGH